MVLWEYHGLWPQTEDIQVLVQLPARSEEGTETTQKYIKTAGTLFFRLYVHGTR